MLGIYRRPSTTSDFSTHDPGVMAHTHRVDHLADRHVVVDGVA